MEHEPTSEATAPSLLAAISTCTMLALLAGAIWMGLRPRPDRLVAARDLPAYHLIGPGDVTLVRGNSASPSASPVATATRATPTITTVRRPTGTPGVMPSDNAGQAASSLVGRVTRRAVAKGEQLTEGTTLALPASASGWAVLTIPRAGAPLFAAGAPIRLVGIDGKTGQAQGVSERAIALGGDGANLVVALPQEELPQAASYLAGDRRLLANHRSSP